jgi:8-oxo-dGTP pyrophosphatase MutT (NUDIX family)
VRLPQEVFVLVRRGDDFLVLHRSPEQGGYWHCVSGALEPGETFVEAAARELGEETGLVAVPVDLDHHFEYDVEEWEPHYRPGGAHVVVESFSAEAPPGWEPELDWEHDEYRWCSVEEACALLYWPEPRELLRELAGA